jgi:NAD(P)-dependent dehydrogenase (short-subunit alcohol dehydrogenase family)
MEINPFSLTNKTILVTGATSGIGLAICDAINEMGGSFIGVGRNTSVLEEKFEAGRHKTIRFDLLQLQNINDLVDQVGQIDGFVHSAGIVDLNPIKFFKPELYEQIRVTNLDSFLYLVNALLKKKKINKGASIVALSSISGLYGMKANGLYGITKAALNIAAKTYANELANQRIRVNTVAPGMVKTKITADTIETLGEEQIKIDEDKYPLGYGEPNDVAYPVAFLLSDAAKWITGEVLVLDGGRTAVI